MKYLIYIAFVALPTIAFSQNKDTNARSKQITTRFQIELAGKLTFGNDNTVKREELLADPTIRTVGCGDCTITSFAMVLTVNGGTYKTTSYSNRFTSEMLDFVKKIGPGSHIIIEEVEYKSSNGTTGWMPGINLVIN